MSTRLAREGVRHPMVRSNPAQLTWTKSTRSGNGDACVEIARDGKVVLVRDSKDQNGAILRFSRTDWRTFVATVGQTSGG
jgi:hypothetical protein